MDNEELLGLLENQRELIDMFSKDMENLLNSYREKMIRGVMIWCLMGTAVDISRNNKEMSKDNAYRLRSLLNTLISDFEKAEKRRKEEERKHE